MGRTAVESVDDTKLMQESKHSLFGDEQQDKIEHPHEYGFVNVPKKPTGSGMMRTAAEAFMSFMSSGRAHGIAMVVGDRRYRLYKLDEGEVALHDDQGHQVHIKRDGVWVSAPNSKKIVAQIMDDDKMPQDQQSSGGSQGGTQQQQNGQIKQAGRPSSNNYTFDKNGLTINSTGTVQINAPTIVMNGNVYLGGTQSQVTRKVGLKDTIDSAGDTLIDNLATKVFGK